MEISLFKITFEYIKGIKNTLADTMSQLILIDPNVQLITEPEGFEYGYYAFDNIDPIETQTEIKKITDRRENGNPIQLPNEEIILPIPTKKLVELQKGDKFCKNILNMLHSEKLHNKNPYYIEEDILKRYIEDNKQRFEVVVLPLLGTVYPNSLTQV